MIADILSQTVADLDRYLNDPTFDAIYCGEIRERLNRLRDEADAIRADLDMPPDEIPVPEPVQDTQPKRQTLAEKMMDEATAFDLSTPCFNRSELIRRGWSKGLIDRLLGGPDWTAQNPHGDNFSPMLCWRQDRVLVAEDTPEFKEHRQRKSQSVDAPQ